MDLGFMAWIKGNRKRVLWSGIIGFIFALLCVWGYRLQNFGYRNNGTKDIVINILFVLLLSVAWGILVFFLFRYADKHETVFSISNQKKVGIVIFLISWLLIFCAWIPAFLAYYPCIMSSDFDSQISQVQQGHAFFTNHHPYLSTLEIELFYSRIGLRIGDVSKGMACLGIFHMAALSFSFSYLVLTLFRLCNSKKVIAIAVFMAVFPVNPIIALSTTKDVLFSAGFLAVLCLFVNRFYFISKRSERIFVDILIIVGGILICSYRNNAVYAWIVAGIFAALILKKKERIWVATVCVVTFLGYLLFQNCLERILHVDNSALGSPEMHSIIIQTFGRTYNEGSDLTDDDRRIIEYYIPADALDDYHPALSDPLKTAVTELTYDSVWQGNTVKLFKDWIKVGVRHPGEYIDAVLDLTRGFWYLWDDSSATVYGNKLEDRMGMLYTFNSSGYYGMEEIPNESKAPGIERFYEKLFTGNECLEWPILNILFRMALYIMLFFLMMAYLAYSKQKENFVLGLFPLAYSLTLFLGPTAYIRYAFPIMISVPLYVFVVLFAHKKSEEKG